ncbi:MAG: hypothetical protein IT160_16665 [Bryobacterales bacterium]|nr:hypothetical protein [Bryobacterales bacterium]
MSGPLRNQLFAIWYFCIAAGFTLLAIQRILVGGVIWLISLRFIIAAGFFGLAWIEWKRPPAD